MLEFTAPETDQLFCPPFSLCLLALPYSNIKQKQLNSSQGQRTCVDRNKHLKESFITMQATAMMHSSSPCSLSVYNSGSQSILDRGPLY